MLWIGGEKKGLQMSSKFLGRENGREVEPFTEKENTGKGVGKLEFSSGHGEMAVPLRRPSGDDE